MVLTKKIFSFLSLVIILSFHWNSINAKNINVKNKNIEMATAPLPSFFSISVTSNITDTIPSSKKDSILKFDEEPIFPGCERVKKSKLSQCFTNKMKNHIKDNFKYPETAKKMGIQGTVFILFVINKKGGIEIKGVNGPDKILENEAERIISLLPKMKPGMHKGNPVNVPLAIPVVFRLD